MDRTTHTSSPEILRDLVGRGNTKATITNLIEVRNLCDIAQVDDSKVLHLLRHAVEGLVHSHALRIPVVAKPNDDDPILLGFDSFVDVPAGGKVGEEVRHGQGMKSRMVQPPSSCARPAHDHANQRLRPGLSCHKRPP